MPIVVAPDSDFLDQKLFFRLFEELGIGYICTNPLDDELTDRAQRMPASAWSVYDNGGEDWEYFEFGKRRQSWKRDGWRRAFYTRPVYEDAQRMLRYARPDTVLYTNPPGQDGPIDRRLEAAGAPE